MLEVRNIKKITGRILRNSANYNLAVSPFIFYNKYLHVMTRSQLAVSATFLQKLSSFYWKTERSIGRNRYWVKTDSHLYSIQDY